jgi:dienelactone hydrolase
MARRLALALLALAVGCSNAPAPGDAGGGGGDDASADAGSDAGPSYPACDDVPPVVIAGTAETDALANAPARCGAPAYAWTHDAMVGTAVSLTRAQSFRAATLMGAAAAAGIPVPRTLTHDVSVDTLVYRTQDRGRVVESSAALVYPADLTARTSVNTVLMTHGTSGFRPGCGPTRDAQWRIIASIFAAMGYVVVAPDFLGLEGAGMPYGAPHPYIVGEPTAIASLDAVRAALRALSGARGPVCGTSDIVVWGASQGGHAALWVDRLAPYYARELRVRGVVAAVPATDIVAHAERAISTEVPATHYWTAIAAAAPVWYGQASRLPDIFAPPHDTDVPAALLTACDPTLPATDPAVLYQPAVRAAAMGGTLGASDPLGCMLRETSLTETSVARLPTDPSYGILFITGEADDLIVPSIERPGYDTLCAAGVPLRYLECAGAGHLEAVEWSLPETMDFVDARFAGMPFTGSCTRDPATRCGGTP